MAKKTHGKKDPPQAQTPAPDPERPLGILGGVSGPLGPQDDPIGSDGAEGLPVNATVILPEAQEPRHPYDLPPPASSEATPIAAPALPAFHDPEPDVAGTQARLVEIAPNDWINPQQVVRARVVGGHFRIWLSDGRELMIDAYRVDAVRRRLGVQ